MRQRVFVGGSVLLALMSCGVSSWYTFHPVLAQFLVPGATEIRVARFSWNELQLQYRLPAEPTPWLSDIAYQLELQGWSSSDKVEYSALTRTYSRATKIGLCELWEWAYLAYDPLQPQSAQIIVRWAIVLPWWNTEATLSALPRDINRLSPER